MKELRIQRNKTESINRQKSRELWLKASDQNLKFFHLSTIIRCQRNNINLIKDNEIWIQGEQEIAHYFKTNFENLFSFSHPRKNPDLENLLWE